MTPQQAAQAAVSIATREHLPLAVIAKLESGATDIVDWFARNIRRFFAPESTAGVESISKKQFRRYVAWMRTTQ